MADTVKLYKVKVAEPYVDHFGDTHRNLVKYVRVIDVVEAFKNGEMKFLDNGYSKWESPVFEASDGRTWVYLANKVDYTGGGFWKPLFEEPRDPALSKHQVGPSLRWIEEKEMKYNRCVDIDGRAVDIEGNPL